MYIPKEALRLVSFSLLEMTLQEVDGGYTKESNNNNTATITCPCQELDICDNY